jgi:hypothetical protein
MALIENRPVNLEQAITDVENLLTEVAARLGPWLAPLPPAYFISRAAQAHLATPWPVALLMAATIELIGIAATHNALKLWTYNQTRRKNDPPAPFELAAVLALTYVVIGVSISSLLEIFPVLASLAPASFFLLAGVGYVSLALSTDHNRRLADITESKAEARARRLANRPHRSLNDYERVNDHERPRTTVNDAALEAGLEAVLAQAGGVFGQADVQAWATVKKTQAYKIINHGLALGKLKQTGRGRYEVA